MIEFFEELHSAVDNAEPLSAPPEDLPGLERTLAIFAQYDVIILPPAAEIGGGEGDWLEPVDHQYHLDGTNIRL